MQKVIILALLACAFLFSCGHDHKNYSIVFDTNSCTIYQKGPRQCEAEEEEIFDELQSSSYQGQYTIYYCPVETNEYSEESYGESFVLCVVDATKIKNASYSNFKGTISNPLGNLYRFMPTR